MNNKVNGEHESALIDVPLVVIVIVIVITITMVINVISLIIPESLSSTDDH